MVTSTSTRAHQTRTRRIQDIKLIGLGLVVWAPVRALLVRMVPAAIMVLVVQDRRLERRGIPSDASKSSACACVGAVDLRSGVVAVGRVGLVRVLRPSATRASSSSSGGRGRTMAIWAPMSAMVGSSVWIRGNGGR